jgi:hypothetical protein
MAKLLVAYNRLIPYLLTQVRATFHADNRFPERARQCIVRCAVPGSDRRDAHAYCRAARQRCGFLPQTCPPTPLNRACRAQGGEDASRRVTRADENAADILRAIECLAANVNEATTFLGKVGKTEEGCANNFPAVLPPGGFL